MNIALAVMYHEGFWLRNDKAKKLARYFFFFLRMYQRCAALCHGKGLRRYPLVPKAHFLCHVPVTLENLAERSRWVPNPLATSNQLQEDFVGRPSRISRRVHLRTIARRVLDRSLLMVQRSLEESDQDSRGMDAYKDL